MSEKFTETDLRRQFIDPMFELLGWDVLNHQGHAEAFQEVVHEDSLKIGGHTKSPDYSFRIGAMRIFFVEVKRPSVKLNQDIAPAFQLRRYGWSAKLPLSILTDFEEFAVYDCRVRPDKADNPPTARVMYLTFDLLNSRLLDWLITLSNSRFGQGSLGSIAFVRAAMTPASVLGNADRWMLALVISQSVAAICLGGTLIGSMLPLLFKRLGFDPGYASSPFVAIFVDVTGIVPYFSIAKLYLL